MNKIMYFGVILVFIFNFSVARADSWATEQLKNDLQRELILAQQCDSRKHANEFDYCERHLRMIKSKLEALGN